MLIKFSVRIFKKHRPKPAYRTYILKKNGKMGSLGIPTIKDRVYQEYTAFSS